MTALSSSSQPRIAPGFPHQTESAQDCHVLLYPEGMVKLNGSAGQIIQRCDGQRSVAEIVAEMEAAFSAQGLQAEVLAFVQMAADKRWLVWA